MAAAMLVAGGCGPTKHRTAEEYFSDANKHFRGGSLDQAVEEYRGLIDEYPFSPNSEEAELRIAHALFLSGKYAEAVVALNDFQRRHPTSPHLPFVGFAIGMCYAKQMGTIDRDQTAAQNAEVYFQRVTQQYPQSPFAELARMELAKCQQSMAAHELYIGDFYARHGNNRAAEIRWLTMAARFGTTPAAAKGLLQLGKLYGREGRPEEAALAYTAITELQPEAPESEVARDRLAALKVEPAPAGDPIDTLLAANGRARGAAPLEVVRVPGLESDTVRRPSAGMGPGIMPAYDPFGRGRGRPY
jgi:outer membrane protein assembly factor BamD